ncbi:hypothetical protein CYCD_19440 [Tenuifilaceae bacterium CYCD]|nr:hypothetical protein CYCD_19440 [Tenuifilaceae bacterium CYCD]
MTKLSLVLAALFITVALNSCLDNETEVIYSDYVTVTVIGALPDTVEVNTPIIISLRGTAPNSCWHSIHFAKGVKEDTLCTYAAIATFENHGENCAEVEVTKDTVVTFTPTLAKSYVFQFVKSYTEVTKDTVVVIPAE